MASQKVKKSNLSNEAKLNFKLEMQQTLEGATKAIVPAKNNKAAKKKKLKLEAIDKATLPIIENTENDFSSGIEFQPATNSKGRHTRAIRDIEPGEILIAEKPISWILSADRFATNCHHCCRPFMCYTLVPSPLQVNYT